MKIPDGQRDKLLRLVTLPAPAADSIYNALKDATPRMLAAEFMINHTLHLEFATSGDDDKEVFVSLAARDLTKLRELINRAMVKEKELRQTLAKTDLPLLDMENSE